MRTKTLNILLTVIFTLVSASSFANVGKVTDISGNVSAKQSNDSRKLAINDTIEEDDIIKTDENSHVVITFNDETKFTIGSDSIVTVDDCIYEDKTHIKKLLLNVAKGFFRYISGQTVEKHKDIKIATAASTIGIRGTELFGEVKEDGETLVGLLKCCADITSNAGTVKHENNNKYVRVKHKDAKPEDPLDLELEWLEKAAIALKLEIEDDFFENTGTKHPSLKKK